MSEKDLAHYYTDENYLSRTELIGALKTSLIDGYWNDILAYRSKYAKKLGYRSINNVGFYYTATPVITEKISTIELSCARLVNTIKKMEISHELDESERLCKLAQLKSISSITYGDMDELTLKALLNGTYHDASNDSSHDSVISFLRALNHFLSISPVAPSDNFLADGYGYLLDKVDNLTSFYRTDDFDASSKRALYIPNSDFSYSPYQYIDNLMAEFIVFMGKADSAPLFVKAVASCQYLHYVRPFLERNDELGVLLGLDAFANSELGKESFYLPLAPILEKTDRFNDLFLLTQRTGDLTYYILYSIKVLTPIIDGLISSINAIRVSALKKEANQLSESELKETTITDQGAEQLSIFGGGEAKVAPSKIVETKPIAEPVAPVKETSAPAKEEKVVEPVLEVKPAVEEVKKETPIHAEAPIITKEEKLPTAKKAESTIVTSEPKEDTTSKAAELSLSMPEAALTEKEVKEYVQYLLESNPNLNKNQASFLASHCSIGHFYTIQQFKSYAKCAYETARTSMDKLAEEKYYEKLAVKNKFVYRPIKQGASKE
jgi:hypothetical protein